MLALGLAWRQKFRALSVIHEKGHFEFEFCFPNSCKPAPSIGDAVGGLNSCVNSERKPVCSGKRLLGIHFGTVNIW